MPRQDAETVSGSTFIQVHRHGKRTKRAIQFTWVFAIGDHRLARTGLTYAATAFAVSMNQKIGKMGNIGRKIRRILFQILFRRFIPEREDVLLYPGKDCIWVLHGDPETGWIEQIRGDKCQNTSS